MRFEEAYDGYQCKRLTQSEAAALLGVCNRSFRRYMCRYQELGMVGLLNQRLNTLVVACTTKHWRWQQTFPDQHQHT